MQPPGFLHWHLSIFQVRQHEQENISFIKAPPVCAPSLVSPQELGGTSGRQLYQQWSCGCLSLPSRHKLWGLWTLLLLRSEGSSQWSVGLTWSTKLEVWQVGSGLVIVEGTELPRQQIAMRFQMSLVWQRPRWVAFLTNDINDETEVSLVFKSGT